MSVRQRDTRDRRRAFFADRVAAAATPLAKAVALFDLWRALVRRLPEDQAAGEVNTLIEQLGVRVDELQRRR